MSKCFFTIYDAPDYVKILVFSPEYTRVIWKKNVTLTFPSQGKAKYHKEKFSEKWPELHISQLVNEIERSKDYKFIEYRWINGIETVFPYGKAPRHHMS